MSRYYLINNHEYLCGPLSEKEIRDNMNKDNIIEGVVKVHLSNLIDNDLENFLDLISVGLTGSDLLMDINYDILDVSKEEKNMLYILVSGDASLIVGDSTMIALEHADLILLIMTQNVNTANCDKAFIQTMNAIDFDLSHTKLVINTIMPKKSTGISVQEIVDFFKFDCIGKIKFNTDVINAGNLGEPLALNPNHEFTKQLRSIVTYILQSNDFDNSGNTSHKKSLFGSLFGFLKKK